MNAHKQGLKHNHTCKDTQEQAHIKICTRTQHAKKNTNTHKQIKAHTLTHVDAQIYNADDNTRKP